MLPVALGKMLHGHENLFPINGKYVDTTNKQSLITSLRNYSACPGETAWQHVNSIGRKIHKENTNTEWVFDTENVFHNDFCLLPVELREVLHKSLHSCTPWLIVKGGAKIKALTNGAKNRYIGFLSLPLCPLTSRCVFLRLT